MLTTAHITQYCLEPNPSQAGLLGERWQPAALQSPPPSQDKSSQVKSSQDSSQDSSQVKSSQAKDYSQAAERSSLPPS